MTKLEQLRRKIIESIHGLPWEEAVRKELQEGCEVIYGGKFYIIGLYGDLIFSKYNPAKIKVKPKIHSKNIIGLPITLPRVLQALQKKQISLVVELGYGDRAIRLVQNLRGGWKKYIDWQLTDSQGRELRLEDQDPETIEKLLEIFNK